MFHKSPIFLQLIASTAAASMVFGASPAIGIVTASGHFTVERSEIWGNSTLFDGATVETSTASSEMSLKNGVKLQLAAKSRAQVWENRVRIERGVGQVIAPAAYEIDAAGLKIQAARVRVSLNDRVEVESLAGTARIMSGAGLLLASIPAGHIMSFSMQTGSTGTITRTGCLLYKDGHFILQDENTQEVAELSGNNLAPNTGNRVEVTGSALATKPTVAIATVAINVTSVTQKSEGGCLTVAQALDARTEAPAGTPASSTPAQPAAQAPKTGGGGLSKGAKIGIVAAIAGGGAGAAIALAGKKSSTSP